MKVLFNEISRIFKHHYIGLIVMLVLTILLISFYGVVNINKDNITSNLSNIDQNILNIFDINKESFTQIDGYYIFIIKILEFVFSIYALILGTNIASYDKQKNTRDYLYTKPLKRDRIMKDRIIASSIILLIMTLLVLIISLIIFNIFNRYYELYIILLSTLSLFIISLIFYGIGLIVGGLANKAKIIISLSVWLLFIIIHVLDIYFNLKVLYYLNPFSFFNTNEILSGESYPYSALLISLFYLVFTISFGINIYDSNNNKELNE